MRHDSGYYTRQAQAVLETQHQRVCQVMEALMQHVGFIRSEDVLPEEHEAYEFAKRFLETRRKPPVVERGVVSVEEKRA
jgi:hypothetical protein